MREFLAIVGYLVAAAVQLLWQLAVVLLPFLVCAAVVKYLFA